MTMTYEPAPGRTAPCIWDGCTERMWSWRNPSMCYRHAKPYVAGMRALASLMYWAAVEEGAESELRMGDFFSDKANDRADEASEGWALKARADALGGAMLEAAYPTGASLPPGLEWTR